jgi:hypothetical protein
MGNYYVQIIRDESSGRALLVHRAEHCDLTEVVSLWGSPVGSIWGTCLEEWWCTPTFAWQCYPSADRESLRMLTGGTYEMRSTP